MKKDPKDEEPPPPFPLTIVRRPEWGARRYQFRELIYNPVHYVLLSYFTDSPPCLTDEECRRVVREIQDRHKKEYDYADIAYNFLVGGNGIIYKGRGWTANAHRVKDKFRSYSGKCVEIAYIGDYRKTPPPPIMTTAAKALIDYGIRKNMVEELYETLVKKKDFVW